MDALRVIKWLKGYVKVEVLSDNASAFLSFMATRGVAINNVKKKGEFLHFEMSLLDYRKIRELKREFGRKIKIRHTALCGLPRKLQYVLRRKSIAVGFVLFFTLLILLSRFIWRIEVVGNSTVSSAEVVAAYTELGIYEGIPRMKLDPYKIRDKFTLKLEKISWCSFNIEGSVLTINLSEVRDSDKASRLTHSNIVAECDGIIKKLDVVSGYTKVKVGDVVSMGDVLVSGAPEYSGVFTWSKGSVIAETEQTLRFKVPKIQEKITLKNRKEERNLLNIFGFIMPLYLDGIHFENVSALEEKRLKILGENLPISVIKRSFSEAEKSTAARNKEDCENEAKAMLLKVCKERKTEEIRILDLQIIEHSDYYIFIYKCRLTEEIGIVSKINVTS